MRFYETFCSLCQRRGISPSRVAIEIGISKSAVSKWKNNPDVAPSTETIIQLANFFGVSVTELMCDSNSSSAADDELAEYLDMLRMRPECRVLLSTAKGATKEQVEANIKVIDAIRGIIDAD